MKKFITFAAVMGTVCFQDLNAQPCGPTTIAIGESFRREFRNATHVRWVKINDLFQARFYNDLDYCLAFFDAAGQLLMSGKKVPFDFVPAAVRKETERLRKEAECKHDLLAVAGVYELRDSHRIRYFINLESERLSLSVLGNGNGQPEIVKKVRHTGTETVNGVQAFHYPGACG